MTSLVRIIPVEKGYTPPFFVPYTQRNLYSDLQSNQGRTSESFCIYREDAVVGYFHIITFPLFGTLTQQYIPYGPVLGIEHQDVYTALSDFLRAYGDKHHAVFTRLDFYTASERQDMFRRTPRLGYRAPYLQPRGEMTLDITPDSETLLANMHKKTRYNIRKSLKSGLETKFVRGKSIELWKDTFIILNEQNTKQHDTTTHSKEYFRSLFALLVDPSDHFLAVTEKDGHVLAINIFVVYDGVAYCPFGASNDLGKKLGAYYHIKWSSIIQMKEHNIHTFNWGGISVSEHDQYLAGVTAFKQGFGGVEHVHPPLRDMVHKKFWYLLYLIYKFLKQ